MGVFAKLSYLSIRSKFFGVGSCRINYLLLVSCVTPRFVVSLVRESRKCRLVKCFWYEDGVGKFGSIEALTYYGLWEGVICLLIFGVRKLANINLSFFVTDGERSKAGVSAKFGNLQFNEVLPPPDFMDGNKLTLEPNLSIGVFFFGLIGTGVISLFN